MVIIRYEYSELFNLVQFISITNNYLKQVLFEKVPTQAETMLSITDSKMQLSVRKLR